MIAGRLDVLEGILRPKWDFYVKLILQYHPQMFKAVELLFQEISIKLDRWSILTDVLYK